MLDYLFHLHDVNKNKLCHYLFFYLAFCFYFFIFQVNKQNLLLNTRSIETYY